MSVEKPVSLKEFLEKETPQEKLAKHLRSLPDEDKRRRAVIKAAANAEKKQKHE
ncbi:MAG: hypothetical protein WC526_01930 [Patescibacteria group bacterium]